MTSQPLSSISEGHITLVAFAAAESGVVDPRMETFRRIRNHLRWWNSVFPDCKSAVDLCPKSAMKWADASLLKVNDLAVAHYQLLSASWDEVVDSLVQAELGSGDSRSLTFLACCTYADKLDTARVVLEQALADVRAAMPMILGNQ